MISLEKIERNTLGLAVFYWTRKLVTTIPIRIETMMVLCRWKKAFRENCTYICHQRLILLCKFMRILSLISLIIVAKNASKHTNESSPNDFKIDHASILKLYEQLKNISYKNCIGIVELPLCRCVFLLRTLFTCAHSLGEWKKLYNFQRI